MTFNWPDIPFSGTEVDAFVAEYKTLAEAIMNDMDDDNDVHPVAAFKLKTPYQSKKNLKLYLEYGLLYSAFIVKQRAGNSGPGTDFELGNSPVGPIFTEDQAQDFAERLGCTFTKKSIECSFRNSKDLDGEPLMDCGSYGSSFSSTSYNLCDFFDGYFPPYGEPSPGDPDEPKPCDDFWGEILNKSQQDQEDPNCLAKSLPGLVSLFTQFAGGYSLRLMYGLLLNYLNGYGGVMDNYQWNLIGGYNADEWLRGTTATWAQATKKTRYTNAGINDLFEYGFIPGQPIPNHEFDGYTVQLVSSDSSAYGVSGGRVWILSTKSMIKFPSLKNVLGNYTFITDGNETIATDPDNGHTYITSISSSNIKQIRDDYDFDDYGWKLLRDADLPGDDFDDDQIQSGFLYTDDTITPCNVVAQEGANNIGQGFYSGTSRWIVANTHGTGRTVAGDYTNALCKSKPFAIKLTF